MAVVTPSTGPTLPVGCERRSIVPVGPAPVHRPPAWGTDRGFRGDAAYHRQNTWPTEAPEGVHGDSDEMTTCRS
jgi:hypothetical protein